MDPDKMSDLEKLLRSEVPDDEILVRTTVTLRRDQKMKLHMYKEALLEVHGCKVTVDRLIQAILDNFLEKTTYER